MGTEQDLHLDQPLQSAIEEIKETFSKRYPEATFSVARGDDPEGIYLRATVDLDDVDQLLDTILDEMYDVQVERALPIYVIPLQPMSRVVRDLSARRQPARPRIDWETVRSLG